MSFISLRFFSSVALMIYSLQSCIFSKTLVKEFIELPASHAAVRTVTALPEFETMEKRFRIDGKIRKFSALRPA